MSLLPKALREQFKDGNHVEALESISERMLGVRSQCGHGNNATRKLRPLSVSIPWIDQDRQHQTLSKRHQNKGAVAGFHQVNRRILVDDPRFAKDARDLR
jgi:hypothetical protein